MNISEILRGLVDLIDGKKDADAEQDSETSTETDSEETQGIMIPPLQQKIELLKRSVDVPNVYDQDECDCGDGCECDQPSADAESDELDRIKKIAGVPVAAIMTMTDDDPLDN